AMHERVGVERAEAAVENVEERCRGLVVVGVLAEDVAAERDCLAEPAPREKCGKLTALRLARTGVELGGLAEGRGRGLALAETVQHVAAMQVVFGAARRRLDRGVDSGARGRGATAYHLDAGHHAQCRGIA